MDLTHHDKDAVYALVARLVRAQTANVRAKKEFEAARAKLDLAGTDLANVNAAFSVFGFPDAGKKDWKPVIDFIGIQRWNEALAVGRGEVVAKPNESPDEGDEEDYEPSAGDGDNLIPSNIKEMVLEQLRIAGDQGTKVASIKAAISAQGMEMHEKKVGMTLYGLSKDGFVRREGRTWFFVSPKGDTKNPDAGASGSD